MTTTDIQEIAHTITKIYKDQVYNELQEISERINFIFSQVFDRNCEDYSLVFSNSVYKNKKVYSVIYRIKDSKSLYEKLHRKNLIFQLIQKYSITTQNIDSLSSKLINEIKNEFDDNIGFRILCDLKIDVKKSFDLILNNEAQFEGIKFLNLNDQPKTKKNGLAIYKIDCQFEDVLFELQIKSKLESAWDDLEHDMYYKDHNIDIIKTINNKSLIHIGTLLKQLDTFMCDLRDMNTQKKEYDKIEKLTKIEDKYKDDITKLIEEFSFNFSTISEQLLFMFGDQIENLPSTSHFYGFLDAIISNRLKCHDTWEIMILEAIYNDIYPKPQDKSFEEKYFEFICYINTIDDEYKDIIKKIYTKCFSELDGSKHLLDMKRYYELYELYKALSEIYLDEDLDEGINNNLNILFGLQYFGLKNNLFNDQSLLNTYDEVYRILVSRVEDNYKHLTKIIDKIGM